MRVLIAWLTWVLVLSSQCLQGSDLQKFTFAPAKDMERADLVRGDSLKDPRGVLVLCPGLNGNGAEWADSREWKDFAKKHRLGLVGISFASTQGHVNQGRGYYYVNDGSGEILLRGLRKIYGKDLPILLYGFSGGADFTIRFADWKPDRVVAWCAYSMGWAHLPARGASSPGLVACGDKDASNYGTSLSYFLQGRAIGKRWAWLSVPKTGHVLSSKLEDFVRNYFSAILDPSNPEAVPQWRDYGTEGELSPGEIKRQPTLAVWLPNPKIVSEWSALHEP